jgi:hypothetical protein
VVVLGYFYSLIELRQTNQFSFIELEGLIFEFVGEGIDDFV